MKHTVDIFYITIKQNKYGDTINLFILPSFNPIRSD